MNTADSRPKTLYQQRMAAFDAMEDEQATWQYKLKVLLSGLGISGVAGALFVPLAAFPYLIPADLAGVGLMMLVGAAAGWLFFAAAIVEDWLSGVVNGYWFFRIACSALLLAAGLAGLYRIFVTRHTWLLHMRS